MWQLSIHGANLGDGQKWCSSYCYPSAKAVLGHRATSSPAWHFLCTAVYLDTTEGGSSTCDCLPGILLKVPGKAEAETQLRSEAEA